MLIGVCNMASGGSTPSTALKHSTIRIHCYLGGSVNACKQDCHTSVQGQGITVCSGTEVYPCW